MGNTTKWYRGRILLNRALAIICLETPQVENSLTNYRYVRWTEYRHHLLALGFFKAILPYPETLYLTELSHLLY